MDRRVPKVLDRFSQNGSMLDSLSFLKFEDWIGIKEHEKNDWITVARKWREESKTRLSDFFTFSAMVPASEENRAKLLSNCEWEIYHDFFGKPSFYTTDRDHTWLYDDGTKKIVNNIEFRPFVLYRDFHGYKPSCFELVQNFLLYHNAFFEQEEKEYRFIDEDGELQKLARIKENGDNQIIEVDAHWLKDYLAANKCFLVRFHDHRRFVKEDVGDLIQKGILRQRFSDRYCLLELYIGENELGIQDFKSLSVLFGKDIVLPYPTPDKRKMTFLLDVDKKYANFIIDLDENGTPIEATCDESKLSNYFEDRGTPHILTPVFFKKEVLKKYYDEPSRYRVTSNSIYCLDLWHLPFDITEEGLVQVWLGDLGRIPYKEQLHWKCYNVLPKGTITKRRWLTDFLAEFPDPSDIPDPIYRFKAVYEEIQLLFREKFGEPLFLPLGKEDSHAYESLHLPVTEEWSEFDEQILYLSKLLVDSLNVKFLSKRTSYKINDKVNGKKLKPLDLLELFLKKLSVSEKDIKFIMSSLRAMWAIRSYGSAHRKGKEFNKILQKYGLAKLSNRRKIDKLVKNLIQALALIGEYVSRLE